MTPHEFDNIYKAYWWLVLNVAKRNLNHLKYDNYYSEEVASYVFIHLWKSQPVFKTTDSIRSWLCIATKRRVMDLLKSDSRHPINAITEEELELPQDEIDRLEIAKSVMEYVMKEIKCFTAREKQIFDLHFLQELNAKKISEITQTRPQTVLNQLCNLKAKLRASIKNGPIRLKAQ